MAKKALISVSDKSNLELLLKAISDLGYSFISTGGTAKFIREAGFQVAEVSELTHFPEMLGGRVKTLHPKVLAGILARRDHEPDLADLKEHDIDQIDLVVVNLYPFEEVINKEKAVFAEGIENIDIGGPTLLRSAAKNYKDITVLSDPSQYMDFVEVLKNHGVDSTEMQAMREKLAIRVFEHVSNYDKLISKFLDEKLTRSPIGASYKLAENPEPQAESKTLPECLNLNLELKTKLRYGENPHQLAGLYTDSSEPLKGLAAAKQLHGKEISFNNLLDLDAAWNIVSEYEADVPCAAVIKHNNPCGVAIAPSAAQAFSDALSCDTVSAFGGIVAFNTEVDIVAANEMVEIFLEAIIAPSFTDEALELLKTKKNLRLIEAQRPKEDKGFDIKRISGGYLIQEKDEFLHDPEQLKVPTEKQIEEHQWVDLILAWKIVKHVKSNAIVVVKDGKTIGIGCGQTNRVKAVLDSLADSDMDTRDAVLASDGFFPFADNINLAAQNHISAVIQPGGSIRDQEVVDACNDSGIAMVLTSTRHFKH